MRVHNGRRAAVFALLAAAWAGVLFFFSGQSGTDSGALSMALTRFLFGKLIERGADVDLLHHLVRKAAHFGIFAVEGFLAGMSLLYILRTRSAVVLTALAVAALAAANELHQQMSVGRVCSSRDMIIDACGGLAGLLFAAAILCVAGLTRRRKTHDRQ